MPNLTRVYVRMGEQQKSYLQLLAAELRACPGDVLLALAFGKVEQDIDGLNGDELAAWLQDLKDYVDARKVPSKDPAEINNWAPGGRIAVEVPRA